jgi:hypothetical protein
MQKFFLTLALSLCATSSFAATPASKYLCHDTFEVGKGHAENMIIIQSDGSLVLYHQTNERWWRWEAESRVYQSTGGATNMTGSFVSNDGCEITAKADKKVEFSCQGDVWLASCYWERLGE